MLVVSAGGSYGTDNYNAKKIKWQKSLLIGKIFIRTMILVKQV